MQLARIKCFIHGSVGILNQSEWLLESRYLPILNSRAHSWCYPSLLSSFKKEEQRKPRLRARSLASCVTMTTSPSQFPHTEGKSKSQIELLWEHSVDKQPWLLCSGLCVLTQIGCVTAGSGAGRQARLLNRYS